MRPKRTIRVLGIETSCDETAAAVVRVAGSRREGFTFDVRSNVVASQVRIHTRYGGVVPEVAAREHVTAIIPVVEEALRQVFSPQPPAARTRRRPRTRGAGGWKLAASVDAIAVTSGPGLISSLAVGVESARTIAYAWRKPLIAVNHIEGHVLSSLLPLGRRGGDGRSPSRFPALALVVSGGHTELLLMRGWGKYRCIGATRDDAAGEAFDKVAKLLGLAYPGGPAVSAAAERGDPTVFSFPRGMIHSRDFDFSFSGLKTAVRYLIEGRVPLVSFRTEPKAKVRDRARSSEISPLRSQARGACPEPSRGSRNNTMARDICASFQAAVVDVLVAKTIRAAREHRVRTIFLGGGVAANVVLRQRLHDAVHRDLPNSELRTPSLEYTGDNAAMIAAAGGIRLLLGERTPWRRLTVDPNWELGRE